MAISASKSRVMGDCQARFREGLGCDSPAYSIIFFNVDRADQLDYRRWRDNIKKVVRETLRAG